MHDAIYQISLKPIEEDDFITSYTVEDNTDWVDYANIEEGEVRLERINTLAENILPKGMFTVDPEGDVLTYHGGLDKWAEDYANRIHDASARINPRNVLDWRDKYTLASLLERPTDDHTMFVIEDNWNAEFSGKFFEHIKGLNVGDKLYIGSVMDYHW